MSRLIKSTSSECRLYVGNLPQFVKNRDIESIFDRYGPIKAIDIHNRFDPAFAFIEFEDYRDADDAVYEKDGEKFEGQRIKVQFPRNSPAFGRGNHSRRRDDRDDDRGGERGGYTQGRGGRGPPIRRTENRVLVSGLPPTGSWQDLKDHMREAGEVVYADVYKDGTAVCEFASHSDMKWAIKYLDDSKFKSHENETSYVRVKKDGGARSRSPPNRFKRSRSRSRSRSPAKRSRSPGRRSTSRSRSPVNRRFTRSRSPQRERSHSRSGSRKR